MKRTKSSANNSNDKVVRRRKESQASSLQTSSLFSVNGSKGKQDITSNSNITSHDTSHDNVEQKNKGGRSSKLTNSLMNRLVEAIAEGNYYEAACSYAGIHYATYRDWMVKGERDLQEGVESNYTELYEAVKKAEAEAEVNLVKQWKKHTPGDWKAIATFLERRYPDRWSRRHAVELTGKGGGPVELQRQYYVVQEIINNPESRDKIAEQFRKREHSARFGQSE